MTVIKKKKKAPAKKAALKLQDIIVEAIRDKKGENIIGLNIGKISESVADFFIICEADNTTQVGAIAGSVEALAKKKLGEIPWHTEGHQSNEWVLIDYVDIVVHIFLTEKRNFFQLEDLWSDAEITEYPQA